MNEIYISNVIGAPSPTAVIVTKEKINEINWQKKANEIYYFLKSKNIHFSKMSIINFKEGNEYDFKFIQLKIKDGKLLTETNANCGNSMIASARIIYMLSEKNNKTLNDIIITNIDTGLKIKIVKNENCFNLEFVSLVGKNIDDTKMFEGSELAYINEDFGNVNFTMLDVVNPYIIIDAKKIGIQDKSTLLGLNEEDIDILEKVKKIRKDIINKYNFSEDSEFPKIAIVLSNGELVARTIYLDSWHKGLPLTAAISIAVASKMKNSVIYNDLDNNEILNPKGSKNVTIQTDNIGNILMCKVFNVKAKGEISMYTDEENIMES